MMNDELVLRLIGAAVAARNSDKNRNHQFNQFNLRSIICGNPFNPLDLRSIKLVLRFIGDVVLRLVGAAVVTANL